MDNTSNLLQINNLHFRWPNSQRGVLNIPCLEIHQGERIFLSGESGSGKTTLLSLIGGLHTPQKGNIKVLNQTLDTLNQSQRDQFRADHIGFIFQLFNLIPYLSVIENITLSCQFSKVRAQRALKNSKSLEQEALRLLADLQLNDPSVIHKPVVELSVGQQQRVATARALIGSPELIIADEPTSALDTDTQMHFINLLLKECEHHNTSIIFVSHDKSLETVFDRTISLSEINFQKPLNTISNRGSI